MSAEHSPGSAGPEQVRWDLAPADPATFSGKAFTALLAASADGAALKLYFVRFQPRARTHWHSHSGEQTLLVQEGDCRYQALGEPVTVLGPGALIRIPAGVVHWHGAGPEGAMSHVAINRDNESTRWLQAVTAAEYAT